MGASLDALDRLETIAACFRAIESLIAPSGESDSLNRDDLSTLISFINTEHKSAIAALSNCRM